MLVLTYCHSCLWLAGWLAGWLTGSAISLADLLQAHWMGGTDEPASPSREQVGFVRATNKQIEASSRQPGTKWNGSPANSANRPTDSLCSYSCSKFAKQYAQQ
jgi:hypothetical protein